MLQSRRIIIAACWHDCHAFVVWALVAATAVFWGLRLFVRPPAAPAHARGRRRRPVAMRGDLTRLLGAAPAPAAAAAAPVAERQSRFKLLGVMAPSRAAAGASGRRRADRRRRQAGHGPIAVGARVDGELVLQSVSLRTASIGPPQGGPAVTLELPPLPPPATGTLPRARADGVQFGRAAVLPPAAAPMAARPAAPRRPPAPVQAAAAGAAAGSSAADDAGTAADGAARRRLARSGA